MIKRQQALRYNKEVISMLTNFGSKTCFSDFLDCFPPAAFDSFQSPTPDSIKSASQKDVTNIGDAWLRLELFQYF